MNNIGTTKVLAEKVLSDTDWKVSNNSEVVVDKIEDSLVYLRVKEPIEATQIFDQTDPKKGVTFNPAKKIIPKGATLLGFYSSCTNKPYRF
jgi:hypothetical protein